MSEKRFTIKYQDDYWSVIDNHNSDKVCIINGILTEIEAIWLCDFMNEQQEVIEELQVSDEMGWKRAEMFEKKCPKELHNKKMYIKRLEYKVQKFKEENEQLKQEHKIAIDEMITDYKNLEKEIKRLKCMNNQLERRLDYSVAYDMGECE